MLSGIKVNGRLIPAHAGKTAGCRGSACPTPAHPRSRGENHIPPARVGGGEGSSPLTRGKLFIQCYRILNHRLIPAHAGKTINVSLTALPLPAHPRSRGENVFPKWRRLSVPGSSPLTRGKPGIDGNTGNAGRLIPAHAGKTGGAAWCCTEDGAHPRSRGENVELGVEAEKEAGSSPLTRGKLPGRDQD